MRFIINQEKETDATRSGVADILYKENIPLDNGMSLQVTLQEDFENDATTRTGGLSEGTYTILGYDAADDSYVGKTVGTVNSSGVFEGDEKLFVVDNTYNFVCVANGDELLEEDKTFKMSRNATNRPTISNTVMNQSLTTDVNKEIAFEMKHTEARVRVKLTGNELGRAHV